MSDPIQAAGVACEACRDHGFHCAESIIRGTATALGIELPSAVLKATGGFSGGGGGCRESCGLLEAGVALISYVHGRTEINEDDAACYYLIRLYHERFHTAFGSINCRVLRPDNRYMSGKRDCSPLFGPAARILAEILVNAPQLIRDMPTEERRH